MIVRIVLFGLCLLCVVSKAQAFGAAGHRQVCQLAYQLIKPATRQQVDALLQMAPVQEYAQGCVWPDLVLRQAEYQFTAPLHYLNVPRSQARLKPADCAAKGCVLSAMQHYAALLKHGAHNRQQAEALLFYSHFVADLHQPLHISYADDLGGNKTALYYFGAPANLHSVWDTAMLKSLGYADDLALAGKKLAQLSAGKVRRWQAGYAEVWAQQSLTQTRLIYQQYRPGMLFSEKELSRDGPVIEQRLLQAAVRLATQLEQLLQPPAGN